MAAKITIDYVENQEYLFSTMNDIDRFLREIDKFLKRSGMTLTAFGYLACGDPAFVRKVREGRVPREKTIEKIRKFMERRA